MVPDWAVEQERSRKFFDRVRFAFPIVERFVMPDYEACIDEVGLAPRQRILDIGTGTGALAAVLVRRGHSVHGVDASSSLLQRARERVTGATFDQLSITELGRIAAGSFDAVSMGFVLHGLSRGLREHALREAGRIGSGRVLVFDYGRDRSWLVDVVEWVEGPHYFEFVRQPFEAYLEEAGLRCEAKGEAAGGARWWLTGSATG